MLTFLSPASVYKVIWDIVQLLPILNFLVLCMHAKLLQLCPIPCDPMDCSLPGNSLSMGFFILCTVCPLFMGFSRREYWSGLSCPPPGGLPDPGIEPLSLTSLALAGRFFISNTTWGSPCITVQRKNQVNLCRRLNEHEKNPLIYQTMCLLSTPLEQRSL